LSAPGSSSSGSSGGGAGRRRKRRRGPLAAPESVEGILDRAGESRFASVRPPVAPRVWREAVGARIAERAVPVSFYGGVLLLRVPSSVWAHELSLLSSELCERLRERGIDARELRFRVGAIPAVDRPAERRTVRAVPPPEPVPREIEAPLAGIDDSALRSTILTAIAANLAWQTAVRPAPKEPSEPRPTRAGREADDVTAARRVVRAPRSAERESAPPDRGSPASRGATPGNPAGGRGRPR
jgi:hypothetical protein